MEQNSTTIATTTNETSDLLTKKADRIFFELFDKVFSYLDFASLMNSLTVSHDFYHLLNRYFKQFLISNNLLEVPSITQNLANSEPLTEDHYLKLFRGFYSREVLVAQLATAKQSYTELQLVRYPRCSTYGVKDFSLGAKFAVFHLFNNDIIFLKSEEYLNPLFNMKNISRSNIRKNVTKFCTRARDLFYMTSSGHLHAIFYNQDTPSHELCEGVLSLSLTNPLKDFDCSYVHAVMSLRAKGEQKGEKIAKNVEESKEDKAENKGNVLQDLRYLNLQNLIPEDFNDPERIRKVEGLDDQTLEMFSISNTAGYFIAEGGRIYECDLTVPNNNKYQAFEHRQLKNKFIRKVWCGYNTHFCMEQNELSSIVDWSQKEILAWANTKDFSEYINILKYENITGKELLQADKAFLIERMGMMTEDLQVKFLNAIEKVSKKSYTKPKLYSWGQNNYNQLGLNTSHINVHHPSAITLPELEKGDEIAHVECGWKATMILTTKGRIWATEIPVKKVVKKEEKEDEEEEEQGKKKGKKNKRKESEDLQVKDKETEKVLSKWVDLTPTCCQLKDGRQYKIMKLALSKDHFAALGSNLGKSKKAKIQGKSNKIPTKYEEEEEEEKGAKFKGADHICHRLLWDKSLIKSEYIVGYEDRFLGILEIPFAEFSLKTDIPSHRVKFFKRKGEIVWDRVNKINKI